MNKLSFLIYVADVLPSIAGYLATLIGLSFAAAVLFILGSIIVADTSRDEEWHFGNIKTTLKILPVILLVGLITCFIPSKDTIYLIAGSEVGEMVITSETGEKIISDIQVYIEQQLNPAEE